MKSLFDDDSDDGTKIFRRLSLNEKFNAWLGKYLEIEATFPLQKDVIPINAGRRV